MSTDPDTLSDLTVAEIEDAISEMSDPAALRKVREAEADGKDRVTAIDAINERIDEVIDDDAAADAEAEAEAEDEEPEADRHNPHGDLVRVRPVNGGGHIAGFSFADGELKQVKLDAKVQRALSRGELQLIR